MNTKFFLFLSLIFFNFIPTVSAHTVKISGDVGATIHIEPNDNPRAGEPADAWFALTRKGGQVLPLKECDCQLAVYAEPHAPGEPALLEPTLKPIQAERYEGIPGAVINFPKPGIYELQLSGKPNNIGETFRPFVLKFQVTVAAGKSLATSETLNNVADINQTQNSQNQNFLSPIIIVVILIISMLTIGFLVKFLKKGDTGK
ncbi:MAG: hypothetical protein EAZ76_17320 [Nostocales cyanobacterium]|nr:MAG: hypothetical protein EAZ87_10335 [Nostocales cyanobacterium]TAF07955.1 MAG: hypothetical protein EAZ76_17320 [Nostocales cyanobacterium]